MSTLENLIADIQKEAERETFPIDEPVYRDAGLVATLPILYAGNLASKLCFFARDLGKDEVQNQQPLYGAAGRLVRGGVYRKIYDKEPKNDGDMQAVLEQVVLTNTVPYKPPGNKAYTEGVKKRFRPFLEQFLLLHWQGDKIITLGNEAFNWFAGYGGKGELKEFFARGDRYTANITVTITTKDTESNVHSRQITLFPLPHPSPLNQQYYAQFPQLLQQRLEEILG